MKQFGTCLLALGLAFAGDRPPLGLDLYRPYPQDNPLTREKVVLGRRLFFDSRLSLDGTVACATCHDPRRAFTDGRTVAVGIGGSFGTRNVPTLINRVYGKLQFWDGRAPSLEKQAIQPLLNPIEMGTTVEKVEQLTGLSFEEVIKALASYLRSILDGDSPFDRYTSGRSDSLSAEAKQGLILFRGKAGCWSCHSGATFSDERLHNTGIAWRDGILTDPGDGSGSFKTPTLREVTRTAPYMHDGSFAKLEDVIDFYDRGGNPNPGLDPQLHPLHLSREEKQALLVFLRALSGKILEGP